MQIKSLDSSAGQSRLALGLGCCYPVCWDILLAPSACAWLRGKCPQCCQRASRSCSLGRHQRRTNNLRRDLLPDPKPQIHPQPRQLQPQWAEREDCQTKVAEQLLPLGMLLTTNNHHHHHTPAEINSSAKMERKLPNRPRPRRKHRQRQEVP